MKKRAAIYIRTSSEKQAEKVSPEVQLADCLEYCRVHGYAVVRVYKDTERYRIGKRMVEPSGTRADRPELKRMLADARAGLFNLIVAWREDRLYRSYRPMLDVLDCIEDMKVDIELVKETFDRKLAPVKAWAAKMELDAKSDRMAMGVRGRFSDGKVWSGSIPYGYCKNAEGKGQEYPEESRWVKLIWQWWSERVKLNEIRRRLIEGGAPQRHPSMIKFRWQRKRIEGILNNAVYHTGIQVMRWGDRTYEIPYPILVDAETARKAKEIKAETKSYPARHIKHDYLAMRLARCAVCKNRLASTTSRRWRRKGKPRNTFARYYRCPNFYRGNHVEGCPHQINVRKLDTELWRKVMLVLSEESDFEARVQARVEELRQEEADAEGSIERMKREIAKITEERQWVITQARKKSISEADMEQQLAVLDMQQVELRRELSEKSLLVGDRAGRLIEFAKQYRAGMRAKLAWLNSELQDEEEVKRQFKARREIVEAIVRDVWVYGDKTIKVDFEFEIPGSENCDGPS